MKREREPEGSEDKVRPLKPNDEFLFFEELPFDFQADLPLSLGCGVELDELPYNWLARADPGVADYLLPGYSLEGLGRCNCCIRSSDCLGKPDTLTPKDLIFLSVVGLRLQEPLRISAVSHFVIDESTANFAKASRLSLSSPWFLAPARYTASTLEKVRTIQESLLQVEREKYTRLQTAINYFGQVTLGSCTSYQLCEIGLFAALEALFAPTRNKAKTLGRRVARFLSAFENESNLAKWVESEYIHGRSQLGHGIHEAGFGAPISQSHLDSLGWLHEITRLCLLGFLGLDGTTLTNVSRGPTKSLREPIDALPPVSGGFLENHKFEGLSSLSSLQTKP